jgi:hypothetical protein
LNILEPALGEIICVLRFKPTGAEEEGTLVGRLEPSVLPPGSPDDGLLTRHSVIGQRVLSHQS